MAIEFITTRDLDPGKIRIVKLKEQPEALVEYTCPSCGKSERRKEVWQEPFVIGTGAKKKFLVRCSKCGYEIKLLKLKKEKKKKKK